MAIALQSMFVVEGISRAEQGKGKNDFAAQFSECVAVKAGATIPRRRNPSLVLAFAAPKEAFRTAATFIADFLPQPHRAIPQQIFILMYFGGPWKTILFELPAHH
jgi:hypothetical protein